MKKVLVSWLFPFLILATGCAPGYHRYSTGCVDCRYCPPPPLQHVHYQDCVCHSCAARPYVRFTAEPPAQTDRAEAVYPPAPDEPE